MKLRKIISVKIAALIFLLLASTHLWAADETFAPGAYIIDMGASNQTIDNGLEPYGLVYELIMTYNVPVRWAIRSNKLKDQADFIANGKSYKGGSFIVPVGYLSSDVITTLNSWESGGVIVDGPIPSGFTAPIYTELTSWPRAVLDLDNGVKLAKPYFDNARIPESAYVTAGNPTMLTGCNDIYIMPHADPHNWQQSWKTALINYVSNGGYLWAACHAVSALEEFVPGANFLSEDGLLDWDHHGDGDLNYTYDQAYSGDPIMQFIGDLDDATDKGSERIYMPNPGDDWRSTTKIAVYQPSHADADPNEAAVLVYGRAFGNANSGMVMYEAGHELDVEGSEAQQVAAQRAFFNFILMAGVDKEISVSSTVPTFVASGSTINISASGSDGSSPYTYEWSSSCNGGSFADDESASTTYTAPITGSDVTCVITVKVTDACGRFSYESTSVVVGPAVGPTAVDDDATTPLNTPVDIAILDNDTEGDAAIDPTTVSFTGTPPNPTTEGAFTVNPTTGLVTFTPVTGFTGTVSIDYEVCDLNSLCDQATITVEITNIEADLEITKIADLAALKPGETLTYTITVKNNGSDDASDVVVNDVIPTKLDLVSATPTVGSWSAPDWTIGSLANGASVSMTVITTVKLTADGNVENTATVDSSTDDPDIDNNTSSVTVNITPLVGPTAVDDDASTPLNTPVDIAVLDNDTEGDGTLDPTSVSFTGTPPNPTTEGVFTVNPTTGLVTFTPAFGYVGTVSIDYEVCDLNALCDQATITVEITPVNGPTAVDDNAAAVLNTPVNIDALDNDIIGYAPLDPTTVTFVGGTEPNPTTEGTFTVHPTTGIVTFTPITDFLGTVTIDYTVCDLNGLCSTATITVGVDTDGDGCTDDVDDYPTDPDRCFDNYYPAGGNGTLAYEDLWPGKGDYDFNDLILDYRFKTVTNGSNQIVETFATFTIKAFGASYENGFGFQFANDNIADADITSVTGSNLQEGFISLAANGIENGQSIPTIIVYDNTFNIMEHPGMGIGVNTETLAPYVSPETLNIYISYTQNKYTLADLDIPNFNPFIIVNLDRNVEVHLPDYRPTDLADQSIFGTIEDDTDPTSGKYYKTVNNLPWAINIPEPFEYPIEKVDITAAYLKFIEWAEGNGIDDSDWYKDLPGYRNASVIY